MANHESRITNEGRPHSTRQSRERTWNEQIGPFYNVEGASRRLSIAEGEVMKQVEEKKLLGLLTSDEVLVLPSFQFIQAGDGESSVVIPGFSVVLGAFDYNNAEGWIIASWMNSEHRELDGKSVVGYLKETKDLEKSLTLARQQAWRMAQ